MPRKKSWRRSVAKKVVRDGCGSTDGSSTGLSDVGLTHLTDHGGSVPQLMGTSDYGSSNFSDEGNMTCPTDLVSVTREIPGTSVPGLPKSSGWGSARPSHIPDAQLSQKSYMQSQETSYMTSLEKSYMLCQETQKNTCEAKSTKKQNNQIVLSKETLNKCSKSDSCASTELLSPTKSDEQDMYTAIPLSEHTEMRVWDVSNSPYNAVEYEFGSFHQGAEIFSNESRGSQCTINALCSLIYAQFSDISCSIDLDNILIDGDLLYQKVLNDLIEKGKFKSKLLCFDELPNLISIMNKNIVVLKLDVITGMCTEQFGDSTLPTLHQALYIGLQKSNSILVMVGSVCSAIFKRDCKYYFFDSHSHDFNGLSAADGKSFLACFNCITDLVTYLYALYESMMLSFSSQFEVLPLHFKMLSNDDSSAIPSSSSTEQNSQTLKLNEWKTLTDSKKKQSQNTEKEKSGTGFLDGKNSEIHTTLISEYFKDQLQRNDMRQMKSKEKIDRKEYMRLYKQKQRQSTDYKIKEKGYALNSKRTARKSEEYKEKDREYTLKSMNTARQSEEYRKKDREYTLKSMNTARQSEEYRKKDREYTLKSKKSARQSEEYRKKDREYTLKSMNTARQSEEYRKKDREYTLKSKKTARQSEEYKRREAEKKQEARKCHLFKQKEIKIQNECKRKARSKPLTLEKERVAKQQWRLDERNKKSENIQASKRKVIKRKNPSFSEAESLLAKRRRSGFDIDGCIELFHKRISVGPVFICSCCHQTWFKHSVSEVKPPFSEKNKIYCSGLVSVDNKEWICITCKNSIQSGKVPKLSVRNGMKWPDKPKELDLFPLEERLIALRIPFMQMRELPRGRQLSVKGNVVNVPVDIQPVVNALPRPFDENVTVPVKLKKKMSFKSCVFSENVRPLRVLVALHWLMKSSDLYRNANVEIDEQWIKSVTEDSSEILHEFFQLEVRNCSDSRFEDFECAISEVLKDSFFEQNCNKTLHDFFASQVQTVMSSGIVDFDGVVDELLDDSSLHQNLHTINDSIPEEIYDSDAEEVTHENVGNIDTLLDDADLENRNAFTFAPGEGQQPRSIFQDKDSEYLCFPCIFCGQRRMENENRLVPVYYSDVAKWELRSKDRRAANNVPNIFFKLKKLQMKQLNDKANLAIRRCQTGTNKITAGQVRSLECLDDIVKKDEGYYLFKQLRNSPAYLEARKKDIYAMMRQLGLPTWFLSLSSADTRWTDLLKILQNLNEKMKNITGNIEDLTWEQKIKLIQSDPVTCSRYFDHRVQEFINTVLKSEHQPLGKVSDYFYRVEFQQRGSPHIHMIIWIENAPKFNVDSNEDLTAYVDQFLKCCINNADLGSLVDLQIHKHSRTCRKREDRICRFGYPLPPLPRTMILDPLETDKDKYLKLYQNLQKKMNSQQNGYDITYEEFLNNVVQMSEEDYIKCIRSSLNSSKVFLKRHPNEIRVNLYNDNVLRAWKANIDLQFILDPYACAMYIVSYISKSQRGMSNLLHAAAKEARNGNLDIKRQVRHIGNVFSNSVEVSAQEAVYLVLQMPLTKSTRDVVFINTSSADKRVHLLKPKSVLDELPPDSTDVISDNVMKRYSKRPKALENYCLADYVSELDVIYTEENNQDNIEEKHDDEMNDERSEDESFDNSQTVMTLKNGIKIKKRSNPKIIRYVRFNRKTDEENHYREKLLLFSPWRNEERDLLQNFNSYKEHYEAMKHMIENKCSTYEHHVEELEQARLMAEEEYDAFDEVAPGTQQVEAETAEEETVESEAFIYFNPDRATEHREYDIGIEIGCSVSASQIVTNDNVLPDEEYRTLLRSLNIKQRQFYNHVVHWIKTKDAPLYAFLSGGAGVGKSVVIRALYQTLFRMLNLKEGENPDDVRILLCAYTGKAAFNINGSTISSAFKQKYKQADQTLTCDSLNTFRSKYRNLTVVIIDEVSMVSNGMLNFINQRLQELKGTRKPFGGISIIAVGDFFQLKPVNGDWIFNDLTQDATSLSINLWKEHFSLFELTEIMRQKDDVKFAQLLNRLRTNSLSLDDRKILKQCEIDPSAENYQLKSPHLFAENYFMHIFNDSIINSSNTLKVEIKCNDTVVSPKLSKDKQSEAIRKLPTDPNRTANLHCSLIVVVGMIYDLTVNANTEDGLANGASCIVKFIEYKQNETNRPSIIWVQFDECKIGYETRLKYKNRGFYHNDIHHTWTPVFDVKRSFTYNRKTYERIQFPLQPSAGRSVHRAQGTTLESVVIDLSQRKSRKIPHLHYVALSRVTSLKKLQILNFNENALTLDQQVKTEMDRLHSSAQLELCYVPLECIDSNLHFKVAFNNCRSLHRHFEDVKHDKGLLSMDIFALAETRLHKNDDNADYYINEYTLIRNDQATDTLSVRPPHGLAVYLRNDICISSQRLFSTTSTEFIYVNIVHGLTEQQFVALYKSPKMSHTAFFSVLERELFPHVVLSRPLLIIGDFNINVSNGPISIIQNICEKFKCKLISDKPTTDNLTTIDLIFSNIEASAGTVECYWSDHKIVYCYYRNS